MSTIINPRDLTLSTATPRTLAVNMPSDYNWTGSLNGTPVNTVVNNAQTGANHSTLIGNIHNVSLTQIGGDLDDIADGSTYFKMNTTQRNGANRAATALDSSSDYIRSLVSTKLTVAGSNPSTGWVGDSNGIRLYQSGVLRMNLPVSGSPSFSGDIIGGSNIDINGSARFGGSFSASTGQITAMEVNYGFNSSAGAVIRGSSFGVIVDVNTSFGVGVNALGGGSAVGVAGGLISSSGSGIGVKGRVTGSSQKGISAENSAGGVALEVIGSMTITSQTLVSNLNAQLHGGKSIAEVCGVIATQSGTTTVSGNGFQLHSLVAGTRTRAAGGNLVVIESTSDESLKKEIEPEKLGLGFINKLKPVSYRMKKNPKFKYHGFIAQDLEKIIDKNEGDALLQEHEDGIKGIDYVCLISPLVKAVQELSEEVERLKLALNTKSKK